MVLETRKVLRQGASCHSRKLISYVRDVKISALVGTHVDKQLQRPLAHRNQPHPGLQEHWIPLKTIQRSWEHVLSRLLDNLCPQPRPGNVGRHEHLMAGIPADQAPFMIHIPDTGATRGPVQRRVVSSAELAPVE